MLESDPLTLPESGGEPEPQAVIDLWLRVLGVGTLVLVFAAGFILGYGVSR